MAIFDEIKLYVEKKAIASCFLRKFIYVNGFSLTKII